jgi:hypothetical protein
VAESHEWNDTLDVEALVRAAGGYVRASDDLRPRVLEAARLQCRERRAQRWIRHVAAMIVLLGFATASGQQEWQDRGGPLRIVAAAGFDEFFSPTAAASKRSGDGDWRMFEAFSELRRQQAQVLRLAL